MIGSRIAFVIAVIAFIFLTFENIASIFIRILSILMLKAKKIILNRRMISVSFIFIVLSFLSFYLNVFSIQNIAINYISIITENILESRIWNSIFGNNYYIYVYSDSSLNTRIDLFQCHINLFFSSAKTLFLGTKLENGNLICGNYIHSSLSMITEFGLLSLFFISIIYICLKRISKFSFYLRKLQSFRNIFIFMILFLVHGLVARHGLHYYLPALIFCYSITLQFNGIRNNK